MFPPQRRHRLFAGAALLLLVAAAVLWSVHSSRRAPRTGQPADEPDRHSSALSVRAAPNPARPDGAAVNSERAAAPERTPIGAPKPTIPTLAVAAQPPAGPALGPGLTPTAVLQNMRAVFRQYSSRFGSNPVGTNREITSDLNGGNPKQVVFVDPEDGLRISQQGELIDNWGTPFFFHQVSAKEMEIYSAGPDRRMWTSDDLVMK